MQCLSLADCSLGSLPVEALPRMTALVYLDLAHNPGLGAPLAAAPPTMLAPLTSLGSIVLRGSIRGLRQVRHWARCAGAVRWLKALSVRLRTILSGRRYILL